MWFYNCIIKMKKKVLVVIRDGRGYRADPVDNAIAEVDTPNTDMIMEEYPNILINASGEDVWLPAWYQWNSEVWHMTIWSGRVIFQSLERINRSIKDGSFFENEALKWAVSNCKATASALHLMWLLQWEWVHSHIDHLFAILDFCAKEDVTPTKVKAKINTQFFNSFMDFILQHQYQVVRK